jgi:hypothetical protein
MLASSRLGYDGLSSFISIFRQALGDAVLWDSVHVSFVVVRYGSPLLLIDV